MSKRRATDELYGDSTKRLDQTGRREEFTANLRALNSSFAQWVQQQAAQAADQLWVAGVKEYFRHADKLLEDFDDVLANGKQHHSSQSPANDLISTPAGAAAAANGADASLAARSTGAPGGGRKSVTFAPSPSFGAPGSAATPGSAPGSTAATPGSANTANAGHTPAPASGLGFMFAATPGAAPGGEGGELPSPQLGAAGSTPVTKGSAAATPSTGFTFGTPSSSPGFGSTPASAAAGSTPAAAATGFTFGVSSSSIPAGQDSTAAAATAGSSGNGAGFTFGAAAAGSDAGDTAVATASSPALGFGATPSSTPAAAAGSSSGAAGAPAFSFGSLPSSAPGTGSAPAFGFATTPAGGSRTSGSGLFKFPPPAAAAAGGGADDGAAAAGDEGAADDEEPPKHKLELKVDESMWSVLFSSKARLHVRVSKAGGNDWESRGVGTLTVRQPKEGSNSGKTYVMFSTDVGKQLVSSPLMNTSAAIVIPNAPKKCRMSLMVLQYDMPAAGQAGGGSSTPATGARRHALMVCMITMGSEDKVKEFAKVVEDNKPST